MNRRDHLRVLIFGLLFLAGGCMTPIAIGARLESKPDMGMYPATQADFKWLFVDYWGNDSNSPAPALWFLAPFTLLDIPFAIVTDTVLLPYDAYKASKYESSRTSTHQTNTSTDEAPAKPNSER